MKVGCKKDAHAIRLHNIVTHILTSLIPSIGLATQLESVNLFADNGDNNCRPDVKI